MGNELPILPAEREPGDTKASSPMMTVIGIAVASLFLLLGVWPLLGQFWVFEKRLDMDVHSGDFRERMAVFRVKITGRTNTTEFSEEVRRLGIQTPDGPRWEFMHREGLGRRHRSTGYLAALGKMRLLIGLMDTLKTPDDERKAILGATLRNLQAGDTEAIREQADRLAERLPGPKSQREKTGGA